MPKIADTFLMTLTDAWDSCAPIYHDCSFGMILCRTSTNGHWSWETNVRQNWWYNIMQDFTSGPERPMSVKTGLSGPVWKCRAKVERFIESLFMHFSCLVFSATAYVHVIIRDLTCVFFIAKAGSESLILLFIFARA